MRDFRDGQEPDQSANPNVDRVFEMQMLELGLTTSQTVSLPRTDRFFEIRFESIGGLGAHAAGQVLATAVVLRMGLNGANF